MWKYGECQCCYHEAKLFTLSHVLPNPQCQYAICYSCLCQLSEYSRKCPLCRQKCHHLDDTLLGNWIRFYVSLGVIYCTILHPVIVYQLEYQKLTHQLNAFVFEITFGLDMLCFLQLDIISPYFCLRLITLQILWRLSMLSLSHFCDAYFAQLPVEVRMLYLSLLYTCPFNLLNCGKNLANYLYAKRLYWQSLAQLFLPYLGKFLLIIVPWLGWQLCWTGLAQAYPSIQSNLRQHLFCVLTFLNSYLAILFMLCKIMNVPMRSF